MESQAWCPAGHDPGGHRRGVAAFRFRHGHVPGRPGHHLARGAGAAALDGASDWRLYKDVIIPLLNPITVSILIILTHVSLKIFDLIFAMSGKGPGFATDVPGIFVYEMIFRAQRYNFGAAAAIVMLVMVSLVIVPYLARQLKTL
jgi:ABC-type sugar transport system permease subunit